MKTRLLLSAILVLLSLVVVRCGTSAKGKASSSMTSFATPYHAHHDVTAIPQGAYEQIILEYEGVTDKEICRIYAGDTLYWNEVDRIMCGD